MKRLITCIALIASIHPAFSQMAESPKLSETEGIPQVVMNQLFNPKNPAFSRITEEQATSDLKNSWGAGAAGIYLASPDKLRYTEVYGLHVSRIEVFTVEVDTEEGTTYELVNAISVSLQLPGSDKSLTAFYDAFMKAYAPELDVIGFTEQFIPLLQWISPRDCGSMMSMTNLDSLAEFKEHGLTCIEIQYTPSCGG